MANHPAANAELRWADVRIVVSFFDPDAAAAATVQAGDMADFSRSAQVADNILDMSGRWASFEEGAFPLDGSVLIPPRPNEAPTAQLGRWSNRLCDANGVFATPWVCEVVYSPAITSAAVTVSFDTQMTRYAVDFDVEVYQGTTRLSIDAVRGNTQAQVVTAAAGIDYTRIRLTVYTWSHPNSRVRLAEIMPGAIEVNTGADSIIDLDLLNEVDPTSDHLPADELGYTLDNLQRRFDLWNPQGIYKYLVDAYPMDVYVGLGESWGGLEYVHVGRYYYHSAEGDNGQDTTRITARNKLHTLGKTLYRRGRLASMTAYALLREILQDAGETDFVVPTTLQDTTLVAAVPIVTHREAMRMVAQAARACVFVDRDDRINVARVDITTPAVTIDGETNALQYPSPKVDDPYNGVEVTVSTYLDPGGTVQVVATSAVPVSGTLEKWIAFDSPVAGAAVSVTGGPTIASQTIYLYGVRLTLSGSGTANITVQGRRMDVSTAVHLYDQSGTNALVAWPLENPLVTTVAHAQTLAAWRYQWLQRRVIHSGAWCGDPMVEVGQTARIVDEYGQTKDIIITRKDIAFEDGTYNENMGGKGGFV